MNKEQIHETEIEPLMAKIIEISKKRGIAMFATFHIPNEDGADIYSTTHRPDGDGKFNEVCRKCCAIAINGPSQFPAFTITSP